MEVNVYFAKQIMKSKTGSKNHQLFINQQLHLDNVTYQECIEFVYENMRDGDKYLEQDLNEKSPREVTYQEILESKRKDDEFDSGLT
jgi:hypothetical protein